MSDQRHVYVVDDDDMLRRSNVFLLATAGYDVRAFAGGSEFLEEVSVLQSGCVLLDIRMPGLDGFQVMDSMQEQRSRFPTIIMTGHGDVATAVRAMKHGAADFLEKPFEEQSLFEMLEGLFPTLHTQSRSAIERVEAERRLSALTAREMEVLHGLVAGLPNKLMAEQLAVSIRTVEMHRANLMEKLDVKTLADVLRVAFRAGVAPM